MNPFHYEEFDDCIVIHNCPDALDPYGLLDYCENVESEGLGSFRLDGVYPETKQELFDKLKKYA